MVGYLSHGKRGRRLAQLAGQGGGEDRHSPGSGDAGKAYLYDEPALGIRDRFGDPVGWAEFGGEGVPVLSVTLSARLEDEARGLVTRALLDGLARVDGAPDAFCANPASAGVLSGIGWSPSAEGRYLLRDARGGAP